MARVNSPASPRRFAAAFRAISALFSGVMALAERPRPSCRVPGRLRSSRAHELFFDLTGRDLSHADGVADHAAGAALAFKVRSASIIPTVRRA